MGDLAKTGTEQLAASSQRMSLLARLWGTSGVSDGFFTVGY
jgi:hypothetical protein